MAEFVWKQSQIATLGTATNDGKIMRRKFGHTVENPTLEQVKKFQAIMKTLTDDNIANCEVVYIKDYDDSDETVQTV